MMINIAPSRHAPGWSWRAEYAGRLDVPTPDAPTHQGGLCESGWHGDCAQAPVPFGPLPEFGLCDCLCHRVARRPV